jgi:uncharacterized membrane protein YgcG
VTRRRRLVEGQSQPKEGAMSRKLFASIAFAAALFSVRPARATQVEIVVVMWQQDLSVRTEVEQFFGCLVNSSSFGGAWAQQFGLTQVRFRGVYVLGGQAPSTVNLSGNARSMVEAAFQAGTLPSPVPGGTSYLLYLPDGVQGVDGSGIPACQGTYCGVHNGFNFQGGYYDIALVPINCPDCGSVQATLIGEHEAAEAIANMGTAQYEVGDSCEGPRHETQLECCGTMYPIQQLSSAQGETDCQTITATGTMCGCGMLHTMCTQAMDCCTGLSCAPAPEGGMKCCTPLGAACSMSADCCSGQCNAGMCVSPPTPDGGAGSGGTGASDGGGAGGSGGAAGAGGSGGSGAGGNGGSSSGGNNGAGTGDVNSGGCSVVPHSDGTLVILLLLAVLARRKR